MLSYLILQNQDHPLELKSNNYSELPPSPDIVRIEGFEPSRTFVQQFLRLPWLPLHQIRMVGIVGLEPTRAKLNTF